MANCRNCEKYWCEHKYGEILQDDCKDYRPHYVDVDMPIVGSEDKDEVQHTGISKRGGEKEKRTGDTTI